MKNSMLFFLSTFIVAINSSATPVKFICSGPDQHSLEINVDDQYLNNSMRAPDVADVSFVFDSKHFDWKQTQFITLPLNNGQMITEFRQDVINKLYIQQTPTGPDALATVEIERMQVDFDCTKYGEPKGK
jgi:hypothetical protein